MTEWDVLKMTLTVDIPLISPVNFWWFYRDSKSRVFFLILTVDIPEKFPVSVISYRDSTVLACNGRKDDRDFTGMAKPCWQNCCLVCILPNG